MWWDSGQITLLDSVLFSIVSILILYVVGSGILKLICSLSKKSDPSRYFDFLQRTSFRIFFGFAFILLFIYIFSSFGVSFLVSGLIIFATSIVGYGIVYSSAGFKLPSCIYWKRFAFVILVSVILLTVVFLLSTLITGYYGSTNDDGADHTLMIRVILDNPSALLTRSAAPYAHFLLGYPTGSHVLGAFFVTLLGVPIQKIVIMMSVIVPCLTALSCYSTIKGLFENRVLAFLGLIVASFFSVGLLWVPISWGGLPLLMSLYISISVIGLIFILLQKGKMTWISSFLLGLIVFTTTKTYPGALLIVMFWFLLLFSAKLFKRFWGYKGLKLSVSALFNKKNLYIVIAFLVPILLSVPYVYFFYTNAVVGVDFNTQTISSNPFAQAVKPRIAFNWLIDIPTLSVFFSGFGRLFALVPISLIILILLAFPRLSQLLSSIFPAKEFGRSLFLVYSLMLVIMTYLTLTIYMPINFLIALFDSERVFQHIFIPAVILTVVVVFFAFYFSYLAFNRLFHSDKTNSTKLNKTKILACALLVLLLFNVGMLSVPLVTDQQQQYNEIKVLFARYETLNQDDISLLMWIKDTVPSKDFILVSGGDSGQFVSPVTQRQTVSIYSSLRNYTDLMALLTSNSSDLRAIPLMVEYNVSYVYIGSTGTMYALEYPNRRQFNSTQFLSTPYFMLTKEVGDAWLFQFNASAALAAYDAAGPLPKFVDQWHPSTYINILASEGGYTGPTAGIYYGSGRLSVYAFANEGYKLDHWLLNGSYLTGPENPVNVDYLNWNIQPIFR